MDHHDLEGAGQVAHSEVDRRQRRLDKRLGAWYDYIKTMYIRKDIDLEYIWLPRA
jgi:hypothetical protein